MKTNHPLRARC